MIGKVLTFLTPYYNPQKSKNSFKARPVLIIGSADASDYNALPISTITKKANIDADYDYSIDPVGYPLLNLKTRSYVRIHKQTVVNIRSIGKLLGDMKNDYPELYLEILLKLEQYNKNLVIEAL